jgi:4-hydroxy-tetrahydrodipicolinate synthase
MGIGGAYKACNGSKRSLGRGYACSVTADLDLRGVWVPLITPFTSDDAVEVAAIERLCHEYLDAGVAGIVALGTTGEAPALDADEKKLVVGA